MDSLCLMWIEWSKRFLRIGFIRSQGMDVVGGGSEEKLGRGISASTWNRESRETADTDLPPITSHWGWEHCHSPAWAEDHNTPLGNCHGRVFTPSGASRYCWKAGAFKWALQPGCTSGSGGEEGGRWGEVGGRQPQVAPGQARWRAPARQGSCARGAWPAWSSDHLQSVCQVLSEAKHLLGESLYAGQLEGEPECAAHAFIEDNQVNHWGEKVLDSIYVLHQVKTATVFCPHLLWVVEGGPPGQATLHR